MLTESRTVFPQKNIKKESYKPAYAFLGPNPSSDQCTSDEVQQGLDPDHHHH